MLVLASGSIDILRSKRYLVLVLVYQYMIPGTSYRCTLHNSSSVQRTSYFVPLVGGPATSENNFSAKLRFTEHLSTGVEAHLVQSRVRMHARTYEYSDVLNFLACTAVTPSIFGTFFIVHFCDALENFHKSSSQTLSLFRFEMFDFWVFAAGLRYRGIDTMLTCHKEKLKNNSEQLW